MMRFRRGLLDLRVSPTQDYIRHTWNGKRRHQNRRTHMPCDRWPMALDFAKMAAKLQFFSTWINLFRRRCGLPLLRDRLGPAYATTASRTAEVSSRNSRYTLRTSSECRRRQKFCRSRSSDEFRARTPLFAPACTAPVPPEKNEESMKDRLPTRTIKSSLLFADRLADV